jgi:hypothetical protein
VLSAFELGDKEDLAARADRLEMGGLVDRAIHRDGGFFDEVLAQTGVEPVHRLDDTAQVPSLHSEPARSRVRREEEFQHRQDGCHLGVPNPDYPFD